MDKNSIFRVIWLNITFFFYCLNNNLMKKSKRYVRIRWQIVKLWRKIFYEKGICKYCGKEVRYKKDWVNKDVCWMCYWAPPAHVVAELKEKYK